MSEMECNAARFFESMWPRVRRLLQASANGRPAALVAEGDFARQRAVHAQEKRPGGAEARRPKDSVTYLHLTQAEIDYMLSHRHQPAWRVANALGVHMSGVYKVWRAEDPRPADGHKVGGRPRLRGLRNYPGRNTRAQRPGEHA